MDQLNDYADDRLVKGCVYCAAPAETRDHVPSRILLESPYPENLPVVGACWECNNGFSKDEQYFVCLIESVVAGSADPNKIRRKSVAKALERSPSLRARIEMAQRVFDDRIEFEVEPERIRNVILKLARGHAAFELSRPCRREPDSIFWRPLQQMSDEDRDAFDAAHVVELLGEVGSRGIQRLFVIDTVLRSESGEVSPIRLLAQDWVDVQEGFYRYLAIDDVGGITIKMVIAEYLACEVEWKGEDC